MRWHRQAIGPYSVCVVGMREGDGLALNWGYVTCWRCYRQAFKWWLKGLT